MVQVYCAQFGDNERHEAGVHISARSEGSARQEASRVHVWCWKRATPVFIDQMYHEEDGPSVWYGVRGLQGVRADEVPESVMKAFAAWVNEHKESYIGG